VDLYIHSLTRLRRVVLNSLSIWTILPFAFYPRGKSLRCPSYGRMREFHSRSGSCRVKILRLLEVEHRFLGHLAHSPDAILTEWCELLQRYHCCWHSCFTNKLVCLLHWKSRICVVSAGISRTRNYVRNFLRKIIYTLTSVGNYRPVDSVTVKKRVWWNLFLWSLGKRSANMSTYRLCCVAVIFFRSLFNDAVSNSV
jgi:hypothetical protein